MKGKKIMIFLLIIGITVNIFPVNNAATEWVSWYSNTTFSLNEDYIWRLNIGNLKGYRVYISISTNGIIDIYLTDEDNMNKFWNFQSFSSYLSYTGVSAKTIDYTLPSDKICYILIDNTDVFGSASQGSVSGSVNVYYLKYTADPTPDTNNNTNYYLYIYLMIIILGISAPILIMAGIYDHSRKQKKKRMEEESKVIKEEPEPIQEKIEIIYKTPLNCPKCNAPLKSNDVKILNDKAKCLYCDSIFYLEEKST